MTWIIELCKLPKGQDVVYACLWLIALVACMALYQADCVLEAWADAWARRAEAKADEARYLEAAKNGRRPTAESETEEEE